MEIAVNSISVSTISICNRAMTITVQALIRMYFKLQGLFNDLYSHLFHSLDLLCSSKLRRHTDRLYRVAASGNNAKGVLPMRFALQIHAGQHLESASYLSSGNFIFPPRTAPDSGLIWTWLYCVVVLSRLWMQMQTCDVELSLIWKQ